MPTKRNRNNSESSNCSASGFMEDQNINSDHFNLPTNGSTGSSGNADNEVDAAWLRACCTPSGCLLGGHVNLTEPDEIEKIICSNEACSAGPYMHKECFERWEDGLLTYLRSHGRARSWSEKQRRQNLWTKRGYDLAYRACNCICGRGHLRKDLNWSPQDVVLPFENARKVSGEDGAKKKNRKKHKDLPALGNKYTFGAARSKSKAIPNGSKDTRARTSSTSSVMSVDQGYSSSSPSSSEIHGGISFFSPPQNVGRSHMLPSSRNYSGFRNGSSHALNPFSSHSALPEIPDNDVLDLYGKMPMHPTPQSPVFPQSNIHFGSVFHPGAIAQCHIERIERVDDNLTNINGNNCTSVLERMQQPPLQDHRFEEISKMMHDMGISKFPPTSPQQHSWDRVCQQPTLKQHVQHLIPSESFDPSLMPSVNLVGNDHTEIHPGVFGIANLLQMQEHMTPVIGHWNPDECQSAKQGGSDKNNTNSFCNCSSSSNVSESNTLMPFEGFPESATSMLCSDIDLKKPKVLIIPGEMNSTSGGTTCTEINIIPMSSTTFNKRYSFRNFENVLRRHQVNPYHIKMEGEGYGSDDFRNSVLSKLSRAKCSQMNCITCGKDLPIYDHFPLLDGTMFLSPLRNDDRTKDEVKIEVENKCEYLHAVCVCCLEGINNMICRMCENRWNGTFYQLGSLYMYDVFAAAPCCQSRLCCKRCGIAIVDHQVGLKYYSEYSRKVTCPSCGAIDYHFVHPASTYKALGPDNFSHF